LSFSPRHVTLVAAVHYYAIDAACLRCVYLRQIVGGAKREKEVSAESGSRRVMVAEVEEEKRERERSAVQRRGAVRGAGERRWSACK